MDSDEVWNDEPDPSSSADAEWTKISTEFTNAGYREGIVAGKESTVQQGFDDGYATVGVPFGRKIGTLLGVSLAILSLLSSTTPSHSSRLHLAEDQREYLLKETRHISTQLSAIRIVDIAPPDLEAEAHARDHLCASNSSDMDVKVVSLGVQTNTSNEENEKPTMGDIERLQARLEVVIGALGWTVDLT